jgi:hypothetical protein
MKHSGFINNGVMILPPGTALMDIYIQAEHQFFDGSWALASVNLLTDIASRLVAVPKEVLICSLRLLRRQAGNLQIRRGYLTSIWRYYLAEKFWSMDQGIRPLAVIYSGGWKRARNIRCINGR